MNQKLNKKMEESRMWLKHHVNNRSVTSEDRADAARYKAALNVAYKQAGHNAYFANGFYSGVEFEAKQRVEINPKDLHIIEAMYDKLLTHNYSADCGPLVKAKELIDRLKNQLND